MMTPLRLRVLGVVSFIFLCTPFTGAQEGRSTSALSSTLGLPRTVTDFYIPGGQAEPIPRKDRESSLVIRVLEIKPAAEGFRYDLEVYGLDPGRYRLSDYFWYTDKAPLPKLDTELVIKTAHDLGRVPKPEKLENAPPKKLGGYRNVLTGVVVAWAIIFLGILFYRRKTPVEEEAAPPPPTLHEKLSALVLAAAQGELDDAERSKLERLLLGHWKQKLPAIAALPPAEALAQLRAHPDASPLLLELERWLHAPNATIDQQQIMPLIEPFRDV